MHLHSYLLAAGEILGQYTGSVPFAQWLKNYFREHKKFGSRDRRLVADLCFCYFRLGSAFRDRTLEERLLLGQYLCHNNSAFVQELKPGWNETVSLSAAEKIGLLAPEQSRFLFPFMAEISSAIEPEAYALSFLQLPDLFLRIRPGKEKMVLEKLQAAAIPFEQEGACLRLLNSTKMDSVLHLDEDAVVQDWSSQRVLEPLQQAAATRRFQSFWDCCAASGGKTILFHDAYPATRLTASDIRDSILFNLKNRLKRAGIQGVRSFTADISQPQFSQPQKFDVVLCDAPCSGSGTWSRTPEQLLFFQKEKIDHYVSLQKNIALQAFRSLRPNGFFLYITCSVFARENEGVSDFLQDAGLHRISQQYFKGYGKGADTLFAALFTTG